MKVLYFDLIGGASGDMILGALVDAGLPINKLSKALQGLNLSEFKIKSHKVEKKGFSATKVDVQVTKQPPERHLDEIKEIIHKSSLSDHVKTRAITIFERIAETEADIHNQPVDQVHLHELGGTDTIVDITGTLTALELLDIATVYASPIPLGKGFTTGAHGQIPLPSPATTALLKGVPVFGRDIEAELVTPTGAALLAELAVDFGPPPPMVVSSIGYGAGGRDLPIPNLLRVLVGELDTATQESPERLMILETNLDDLNPEIYPYVIDCLFASGALDVTLTPIQMKKNRPGTLLKVLCQPHSSEKMRSIIFQETTTLGVRQYQIDRYTLPRKIETVSTSYGKIRVKVAETDAGIQKISPEYEDCRIAAEKNQVPITQIYQETLRVYHDGGSKK